jgi:hypothetical protein
MEFLICGDAGRNRLQGKVKIAVFFQTDLLELKNSLLIWNAERDKGWSVQQAVPVA